MAVKLPTHTWLFNNELRNLSEGRGDIVYHPEKQKEMQRICEEYKKLEFYEDTAAVNSLTVGAHVALSGYAEYISKPKEPEKLAALLVQVHQVVRDTWIPSDVYRRIGIIFNELQIPIENEELRIATEIASGISYDSSEERARRFRAVMEVEKVQSGRKEVL